MTSAVRLQGLPNAAAASLQALPKFRLLFFFCPLIRGTGNTKMCARNQRHDDNDDAPLWENETI